MFGEDRGYYLDKGTDTKKTYVRRSNGVQSETLFATYVSDVDCPVNIQLIINNYFTGHSEARITKNDTTIASHSVISQGEMSFNDAIDI
ncbi:MAG: hypothetical protein LBU27_09135 [Candidatus Peribacteria bacterium]|jgi:homoserine trans-succinylase|nr:hypothetical protein [Candidatus Peribacteria bacterium]